MPDYRGNLLSQTATFFSVINCPLTFCVLTEKQKQKKGRKKTPAKGGFSFAHNKSVRR
jgi:hypothetical protein